MISRSQRLDLKRKENTLPKRIRDQARFPQSIKNISILRLYQIRICFLNSLWRVGIQKANPVPLFKNVKI